MGNPLVPSRRGGYGNGNVQIISENYLNRIIDDRIHTILEEFEDVPNLRNRQAVKAMLKGLLSAATKAMDESQSRTERNYYRDMCLDVQAMLDVDDKMKIYMEK